MDRLGIGQCSRHCASTPPGFLSMHCSSSCLQGLIASPCNSPPKSFLFICTLRSQIYQGVNGSLGATLSQAQLRVSHPLGKRILKSVLHFPRILQLDCFAHSGVACSPFMGLFSFLPHFPIPLPIPSLIMPQINYLHSNAAPGETQLSQALGDRPGRLLRVTQRIEYPISHLPRSPFVLTGSQTN